MSSHTDGEDIRLLSSAVEENVTRHKRTSTQSTIASQVTETVVHLKWPFRSIGSCRLVLILVWGFVIDCSLRLMLYKLQYPHLQLERSKDENSYSPWLTHWSDITFNITFALSCPIAGYIAEVLVGRYKVISFALRILWLVSIAGSVLSICEYNLPHSDKALYYIQLFMIIAPSYVLKGAFLANAVPLGMDQIADGSHANVCAFIMWLAWSSVGASYTVASVLAPVLYKCSHLQTGHASILISLIPVLLLSVGLVLDFFWSHRLIQEPVSINPVRLIFRVLKYAAMHKLPEQRSALTYWENELPTRLDNGKTKYGGPFTTEQVEDVKTFWRVLVIILVISSFNSTLAPLSESTTDLEKNFDEFRLQSRCAQAGSSSTYTLYAFITYSIPLYELLVYPWLHNSGPNILQTAGVGAALTVASSVYGMMIETTRQVVSNSTLPAECMFSRPEPEHTASTNINHFLVGIPFNFLLGFASIVLYTSNLEFICAQAPYNMKGVLIGLSYMLQTTFSVVGTIPFIAWSNAWLKILHTYSCGTWYYLTTLLVAAGLSVLLSWIVRWYKGRERDETLSTHTLIEDVYYKYDRKDKSRIGLRIIPYQL